MGSRRAGGGASPARTPGRASQPRARVLLLALDGFPHGAVTAERTPVLHALAAAGGRAPGGGVAALPATTYPGFASLLTGCEPARHRVRTTSHRPGAVPGWAGRRRVAVPTLAATAAAAGLEVAAVLGDHHLHRVLRLGSLTRWPAGGHIPRGTALDAHGYPTNAAVLEPLLEVAAEPGWRLLFAHLNEVDTLGHDLGPEDPATVSAQRATDMVVGEVLEALRAGRAGRAGWSRTLVVVVSDHGMEATIARPRIRLDPTDRRLAPWIEDAIGDGGAAWARVRPGLDPAAAGARLGELDGVEGWSVEGTRRLLLTAQTGRSFGRREGGGVHGGPGTAATIAIVGGGHPAVPQLARAIAGRPPRLADWAPTIASILGIALPGSDGVDLLRVDEAGTIERHPADGAPRDGAHGVRGAGSPGRGSLRAGLRLP
jgi:arylsulfatase A-like enzyme